MCGSPRMRLAALIGLATLGLTLAACGTWRTRKDMQRDYARTLRPAPIAEPATAATDARTLPVRVHVDEAYRTEILRWRHRIEAQIARANVVLAAQFGVRLAVREVVPWSRPRRTSTLSAAMDDLLAADPGTDVEWVLGFVSSTELFSGSHEQLGMASMFGRHVVLRGMVSFDEGDAFRRVLDELPDTEREELLHERQLHRETAVLLHEWAHTLGALHERDDRSLMSPRYDPAQSAFSPASARIIQLGLERRSARDGASRAAWAVAYRDEVERSRAAAWDAETVQQALAAAGVLLGEPPSRPGPPKAPTPAPRGETAGGDRAREAKLLIEAELNDRLGDARRALSLVDPIAARYPDRSRLQRYACHLRRRADAADPGLAACAPEKALRPRVAARLFAEVLFEAGDPAGAVEALVRVEAALAEARPPAKPGEWAELAQLLAHIDACTVAERVAVRTPREPDAQGALAWCARTRQRASLPAGSAGVAPAREPEYVEAVVKGRAHALAGRGAAARASASALEAAFPGAPGGLLVRCLADASSGDARSAREACAAADASLPWAFEPAFVLAELAGHEGRWLEARDHLRRALDREPREREIWARLGAVYRKLGDEAELGTLERRHQERFGAKLRPAW